MSIKQPRVVATRTGIYDGNNTHGPFPTDVKSGDWVLQLATCFSSKEEMNEMKDILVDILHAMSKRSVS